MSKAEFNNYNPEIIFVPIHWYYSLLDHKQKRPDYKKITEMAVLGDIYANVTDNDGYINTVYLDGKNTEKILLAKEITSVLEEEYIDQKSHRILIDLIQVISKKNQEYGYLAGYLLSDLILLLDFFNSPDNSCFIPKDLFLKSFNETPQRIRKDLELLKNLNLITFSIDKNGFKISISAPAQIIPFNKKESKQEGNS